MSVFQFIVNVIICVGACVLLGILFAQPRVEFPYEAFVAFLLGVVAIVLTFKYNAAKQLGVG